MEKNARFSQLFGDFVEHLVVHWLSRSGFEGVARVDYVGVDVIARHTRTGRRLGFSVKGRARIENREKRPVRVFDSNADRVKLEEMCTEFGCEPWLAVYVETDHDGDLYFTSLKHYQHRYDSLRAATADWKMGDAWQTAYAQDPQVIHIHFELNECRPWDVAPGEGVARAAV